MKVGDTVVCTIEQVSRRKDIACGKGDRVFREGDVGVITEICPDTGLVGVDDTVALMFADCFEVQE